MKNRKDDKSFLLFLKIVFISAVLEVVFATYYFAHLLNYQKILGGINILGYKIYFPFAYPIWLLKYGHRVPIAIEKVNFAVVISFGGIFLILLIIFSKRNAVTVHGTAKWASMDEIDKMNLKSEYGLVLGCDPKNKIMKDNSDRHVFMAAPTRGGKGINSVTPTAFDWNKSMVINDIKGELWGLTSGYRKHVLGQKVFCFAPVDTDGISCQYNPLDFIAIGTGKEFEDVSVISQTLIDVEGKGESDHWITSAINLLNGIILHVKYANPNASLVDVVQFLTPPTMSFADQIADILGVPREDEEDETGVALRTGAKPPIGNKWTYDQKGELIYSTKGTAAFDHLKHFEDKKLFKKIYNYQGTELDKEARLHPLVTREFMSIYKTPDKERGSIISTASQKLKIFLDPIIAKHIKKTDFTIKQLLEEKCTLYLVTPPKSIHRTRALLRLAFTQIVFQLTDRMTFDTKGKIQKNFIEKLKDDLVKNIKDKFKKAYDYVRPLKNSKEKNRLLLMIDEFPSLGKLEIVEQSMSYVAGYGLKFFLVAQSLNQFKKIYGKDNYILDNCSIQIYLTPNDPETPKMISEMFDTYTEKVVTQSKKGFDLMPTYTTSYVPRKLMTAGEVRTLPYKEIILMITGQNPIHGKKLFYYKDQRYEEKKIPALDCSDILEEVKKDSLSVEKISNIVIKEKTDLDMLRKIEELNAEISNAMEETYFNKKQNLMRKFFNDMYKKDVASGKVPTPMLKPAVKEQIKNIQELHEQNMRNFKNREKEDEEIFMRN